MESYTDTPTAGNIAGEIAPSERSEKRHDQNKPAAEPSSPGRFQGPFGGWAELMNTEMRLKCARSLDSGRLWVGVGALGDLACGRYPVVKYTRWGRIVIPEAHAVGGEFCSVPMRDGRRNVIGFCMLSVSGKQTVFHGRSGLIYRSDWEAAYLEGDGQHEEADTVRSVGPILIVPTAEDVSTLLTIGRCAVGLPGGEADAPLVAELLRDWPVQEDVVVLGEHGWALGVARALESLLGYAVDYAVPPAGHVSCHSWLAARLRDMTEPEVLDGLGETFFGALKYRCTTDVPDAAELAAVVTNAAENLVELPDDSPAALSLRGRAHWRYLSQAARARGEIDEEEDLLARCAAYAAAIGAEMEVARLVAEGEQMSVVVDAQLAEEERMLEFLANHDKTTSRGGATQPLPLPPEANDDPHRLARLFLAAQERRPGQHDDGPVMRRWRGEFWRWDGTCYLRLPSDEVTAEVIAHIKAEFDRIAWADGAQAQKVRSDLVSNVVNALRSLTILPTTAEQPSWLLSDGHTEQRDYIALANGLLDIDAVLAGQPDALAPHSPRWFSGVCLPYVYDSSADCPLWRKFLSRVLEDDPQRIALLQEWFGYCCVQDTSLQKFLALQGTGQNGKSVIFAVLRAILGEKNVSHVPLEMFGERFALTQTLGKLANIVSEVGDLDKAAEGTLKAFTSGDCMTFDRKCMSAVEALPTARFAMAFNTPPRFTDRTDGLWRRMDLIPLRIKITAQERVPGMDKKDWWQAASELPGIFNWSLVGLARLRQTRRFTEADLCKEALADYQLDSNPARQFLVEMCAAAAHDGERVLKALLYSRYREWCSENGRQPLSSREFGKEVRRAFPGVKDGKMDHCGKRHNAHIGLSLVEDAGTMRDLLPALPDDDEVAQQVHKMFLPPPATISNEEADRLLDLLRN